MLTNTQKEHLTKYQMLFLCQKSILPMAKLLF